ncbi:unnamed protein product [Menidia menidia]|uniref:(Atlantic silverside) hypothetical protein n=1 Tax=Menidia menidia TaxID=238744 RepID=A0A8S4AB84_9TELE|nr:unnamed protein product [Menidia menidia]
MWAFPPQARPPRGNRNSAPPGALTLLGQCGGGHVVKGLHLCSSGPPRSAVKLPLLAGVCSIDRRFTYHRAPHCRASLLKAEKDPEWTHSQLKGSVSSCSLSSENPYATISEAPACKHSESSYVEMTSPARREHLTLCCPAPPHATAAAGVHARNVYDIEDLSVTPNPADPHVLQLRLGALLLPGYAQSPYDLPRNSHIPSHYDLLPAGPPHSRPQPPHSLPGSPASSLL